MHHLCVSAIKNLFSLNACMTLFIILQEIFASTWPHFSCALVNSLVWFQTFLVWLNYCSSPSRKPARDMYKKVHCTHQWASLKESRMTESWKDWDVTQTVSLQSINSLIDIALASMFEGEKAVPFRPWRLDRMLHQMTLERTRLDVFLLP